MKRLLSIFIGIVLFLNVNAQVFELNDTINIQGVTINGSFTATKTTPFTFQNLKKNVIVSSLHSEPAILFSRKTPSVSIYSESGTGMGYIYFRLRGIDQTKINSTFNGVPLNEPEDQGVYYNNYSGLLGSVSSIQVIRGVGITKPGISSYGGSINFVPQEFSKNVEGYAQMLWGSYGTGQANVAINSKYAFLSINSGATNGYKYNTSNKYVSAFYGAQFLNIKFYGYVSQQYNGQGWLGETLNNIKNDPRYNSNSISERDDFLQVHNQLNFNYKNFTTTLYYTFLKGKYGVTGINEILIDTINIQSNWIGFNSNYLYQFDKFSINSGVNGYMYDRRHFGTNDFVYGTSYNNTGYKNAFTPYVKFEYKNMALSLYGDLQYRHLLFYYDDNLQYFPVKRYDFIDWSAGFSYNFNENSKIYYGIGKSNKEPKRSDLFYGLEHYPGTYRNLLPERLISNELGFKYIDKFTTFSFNYYLMIFRNELTLNSVGSNSILISDTNVERSYRTGFEFDFDHTHNLWNITSASSFSYNQIKIGNAKNNPILTPRIILNLDVKYGKTLYVGSNIRYNGKSYIDLQNTEILPSYSILNAYSGFIWNTLDVRLNINNIFNKLILANAYINYDSSVRYFVMSGTNLSVSVKVKF